MTPLDIQKRLADFFPAHAIRWKPQAVNGSRALAIAYINARAVMRRLDEVLGIDGWEDHYEILEGGAVVCTLRCKIGDAWVSKEDVGGSTGKGVQSEGGNKIKAAFSDALKRAAVKFGIGRYIGTLPQQWCPYDPQRKVFSSVPKLPDWAIPAAKPKQTPTPAPAPSPSPAQPEKTNGRAASAVLTGEELEEKIRHQAQVWEKAGYCPAREVHLKLGDWAHRLGCDKPIKDWPKEICQQVGAYMRDHLLPEVKRPAPQPVLQTIERLLRDLGHVSPDDQAAYLETAYRVQSGEVPTEYKAQQIILDLQGHLRDDEEARANEPRDEDEEVDIPF